MSAYIGMDMMCSPNHLVSEESIWMQVLVLKIIPPEPCGSYGTLKLGHTLPPRVSS